MVVLGSEVSGFGGSVGEGFRSTDQPAMRGDRYAMCPIRAGLDLNRHLCYAHRQPQRVIGEMLAKFGCSSGAPGAKIKKEHDVSVSQGEGHMQVEFPYTLTRFDQVDYGAVLLTQLASGPVIRAVKAFTTGEDGNRFDHLVSIGPFGDDISDRPVMYLPDALRDGPVLDVTSQCHFRPCVEPEDLQRLDGYSSRDLVGRVVLLKNDILLGVVCPGAGGSWDAVFLSVQTGEIVFRLPDDGAMVSSRWNLIAPRKNAPPVLLLKHRVS